MTMIGPVGRDDSPGVPEVGGKEFVEEVGFEPGVEE